MSREITFVHDSFFVHQNPYISLMTIGWEKCKPLHSCSRIYDTYIIHTVKSGKGTLLLNNKLYHLKEKDTFLIRPNQISKYVADAKDPWHYSYFSFSGVLANSFLNETAFKNDNSVYTLKDDCIFDVIDECISTIRQKESVKISSLEYLFKLLSLLVAEPVYVKEKKPMLVMRIEQYIKENFMRDIQIGEIADAFCISRNYLFRIFKKRYCMGIKTYISTVRLSEAKRLLLTSDLPITQIADAVGFKNYSSFYKLFKSSTNCMPKEYRDIIKHTDDNVAVLKSNNGIYQISSEKDSINYKEKYDTKI